ncbi:acyl transferase [Nocardia sp. NBC_01499]|uniref:acyl transferase n=1 Tax=Nocardia sp. NBC_01499 TaxID=2903597 RepID=UPI003862EFAC
MHITTPNRTLYPPPQRIAVILLGLLTGAIVLSGCASTSSPASTGRSPASTTVSDTPVSSASAPTQPSTSAPGTTAAPVTSTQPAANTHPPSGTTFTGEGLTTQQASDLQQAVDNGHQPWRLDRVQVAKTFAQQRFGWSDVQAETGAPVVVFITNHDGSKVALHLAQPATRGDHGIWVVDSGVWS